MIRLVLFFLIFTGLYSSANSQNLYSEKDRQDFFDAIYNGCLDRQKGSQLNSAIKSGAQEEICRCLGGKITNSVFGRIDFQIALSDKDNKTIKSVVESIANKENTNRLFDVCMDVTADKYGGKSNMFNSAPPKDLSKKIGLTGESRNSFVESGIRKCIQDANNVQNQTSVKTYCTCSSNTVADNISPQDLYKIGTSTKDGKQKLIDVQKVAISSCGKFLK